MLESAIKVALAEARNELEEAVKAADSYQAKHKTKGSEWRLIRQRQRTAALLERALAAAQQALIDNRWALKALETRENVIASIGDEEGSAINPKGG